MYKYMYAGAQKSADNFADLHPSLTSCWMLLGLIQQLITVKVYRAETKARMRAV